MVYVTAEVCFQRRVFGVTGFEATIAGPLPDLPERIPRPGAALRLRTPNAPPAALNRCLAKPIANARLAQ
jgi:hypothetical protein